MEITDLVNTIEGLTEEQAIEIVARAEVLAEEQTDELPRRKGGRAAAALLETSGPGDEPLPGPDESPQAENGEAAGEAASVAYDSPDEVEDETDNHSPAISGDSIEPLDSALPAETETRSRLIYPRTKARIRRRTRLATTRSTTLPWRSRLPVYRPRVTK